MRYLQYGVSNQDIPDDASVGYGARAILKNGIVDYVHDRIDAQVWGSDVDKLAMGAWLNKKGFPWIEQVARKLYSNENRLLSLDDGKFHARINPQASYGYLYITIWMDGGSNAQV